jgi:hypothetical protein
MRSSKGIIRQLDPSDPRSLDHPSHREQWLELARAIGRLEAREEFERLYGKKGQSENAIRKTRHRHRT